jgi:hypothetical protein
LINLICSSVAQFSGVKLLNPSKATAISILFKAPFSYQGATARFKSPKKKNEPRSPGQLFVDSPVTPYYKSFRATLHEYDNIAR